MFANVTIGALAVLIEFGADEVAFLGHRRSLVAFLERERRHYPGETVRVGEHERHGHLVLLGIFVVQDIAVAVVFSLVVVVVDEHQGYGAVHQTPLRTCEQNVSYPNEKLTPAVRVGGLPTRKEYLQKPSTALSCDGEYLRDFPLRPLPPQKHLSLLLRGWG